jgi:hypothetical protein
MRALFAIGTEPKRRAARRFGSAILRAGIIFSMSFAAAFGFLAAMRNPALRYNPHTFATGAAGLFGAACGVVGLLVSALRALSKERRDLRVRIEDSRTAIGSSAKPRSVHARRRALW